MDLEQGRRARVFLAPQPVQNGIVELSVLDYLMAIKDSRNVRVRDLVFELPRGDAVRVSDSEHVSLERCTIRNAGNRGVVVAGGMNSGVTKP